MKMDRNREIKILTDYESVLADAERDIAELRTVIGILRKRVGSNDSGAAPIAPKAVSTPSGIAFVGPGKLRGTYGGRPNIPSLVLKVLSDGRTRSSTEIFEEIVRMTDKPPSRGSVSNRLKDMAMRGDLEAVDRTHYKLAAKDGGTQNHAEPGIPPPGSQLGVEKPPGEELIAPRPGHPYSLEGAPGVAHQAGS